MPKISVIIPVYNTSKYLSECLDSVLNQTLSDIEIICINDGSLDNSLAILKKYAKQDKRIKVLDQKNQGVVVARNNGIAMATADFVYPLDSDDIIVPDCLEKLYNKITQSDYRVVMSNATMFGKYNGFFSQPKLKKLQMYGLHENCIISALFYRKDFIKFGGYCTDFNGYGGDDMDYWLNYIDNNLPMIRLPEILFLYRTKKDSESLWKNYSYEERLARYQYKEKKLQSRHPKMKPWVWLYKFLHGKLCRFFFCTIKKDEKYFYRIFKIIKIPVNKNNVEIKHPCISVIIPCYNVQSFLPQCLDSVLSQTFENFEIICIEDCSTDKTKDILCDYAKQHNRIRVFYNKKNMGQAISRNIGIKMSNAEYIYFLDSDDTISSDCLKILYDKIVKDKCDVVLGTIKPYTMDINSEFCISRNNILQDWVKFKPFAKLRITEENGYSYYEKLNCCPVNKLYKKSFILNNDIWFINKKRFHEDNGFWLKILASKPLMSGLKNETYFYRIRNNSTTSNMNYDEKAHVQNFVSVLYDALIFCKKKHNKIMCDFIKHDIYKNKKHRFYDFVWNKNEKRLRLLFCPIFNFNFNNEKQMYRLKLFWIPVYRWSRK
jgi:glycosyltransferase involved in cell wall biosynthesis